VAIAATAMENYGKLSENCFRFSDGFFLTMKDDINTAISASELRKVPNKNALRKKYESQAAARALIVKDVESRLKKALSALYSQPTIKARTKKFSSYYRKYIGLLRTGIDDPYITDLMGIRIICLFVEDIDLSESLVKEHFDVVEVEKKGHYSFKEFGYESTHLLVKIPDDIAENCGQAGCDVVEIQIRTILQDAWAEVEHEIFYKLEFNPVDSPMKRRLAAVSASLLLADNMFQEIRGHQKRLIQQIKRRRKTFYQKVEASTDEFLFPNLPAPKTQKIEESTVQKVQKKETPAPDSENTSMDDYLLIALKAHNENRFEDAIAVYSRILELKPEKKIVSLIHKHRGMANFAQSNYLDAIEDFTRALEMDPKSYRVAYYRGIVHSVTKKYPEAIDDFSLSLEINPYQAFCLFRRGQAYFHMGDYPQALADCEESVDMDPEKETTKKFRTLIQNKLKM
jgi:putative GTP pyrophosphokinase